MKQQKFFTKKLRSVTLAVISALFLLWLLWVFKWSDNFPRPITLKAPANFWGVTYSKDFTTFLGLDWQATYLAVINDLGVKNIRLPIYWEDIEAKEGTYDFSNYDWLLSQGAAKGIKFILVVGRRQPRWPECHTPDWSKNYNEQVLRPKIAAMITATVNHYKNEPAIAAWQVENEPLLDSFGICPPSDYGWLQQEVALVKNLDQRPGIVTASGELSNWQKETALADNFGTTVYRVVWGYWTGYLRYPWPEWYYGLKLKTTSLAPNKAIIAELQAEPWAPNTSLDQLPKAEADKSFTLTQFRANLQYAINTHFSQAYLWGVEWWYLEKTRGRPEFWNEAKKLKW
jgi:hypothetical protein